jgi:glucuronate isomerase
MLPAGKICGFFSDAYVLEWIYGKAALARKVTAEVLESMVERGFYTMEVAKEVAEQILFENPSKLFSV